MSLVPRFSALFHYNQTFRSLTLRECENSVDRDAWITIDLLILLQVSCLLELAAAMSSAQEKVTGNSKLDMSGIMAALAMAQEEGVSSNGKGQSSFLHGTFRKEHMESTTTTSSSSLVRAEYVKETTCEETQEEKHSIEMVNAGSKKGSFLYKNMEKTVNE